MPERRIPWRKVAHELGGTFEAKTYSTKTRFEIQALVEDQHVVVHGQSSPYGVSGNRTDIQVEERQLAGLNVHVYRDRERTSFWRNLLWRDVEVGDTRFDADWFLRAKHDADAQLVLDEEARRLIQAVPPALRRLNTQDGIGLPPLIYEKAYVASARLSYAPVYYDFAVKGGAASASSDGLEGSVERMLAAIATVVGLTKMQERMTARWEQLARELDGRLEIATGWRVDKATRIVFPLQGMPVHVSLVVHKGRLYTRVGSQCAPGHRPLRNPITPNQQRTQNQLGKPVESALRAARAARVFQDAETICTELAGPVTDSSRLRAAASVVTSLARSGGKEGPYR